MNESLLVAGIVCIVAAIVGGGVKLLGAEVPVLNSFARQALLFTVGVAFLAASYFTSLPKAARDGPVGPPSGAPPVAPPADIARPKAAESNAAGCGAPSGLSCLPASSRAVVFADADRAGAAAWRDYQRGRSTTAATAAAADAGATGRSARLCGIVGSSDSSALGKHLAAVSLVAHTASGSATPDCLAAASAYL